MSLPEVDLEVEAAKLAKIAEVPADQVLAELLEIVNKENRAPFVAVIAWKSRNSYQLGAGKVDMVARVIAKEAPRTTSEGNKVATVHFLTEDPESGEVTFKQSALWDDRIENLWSVFTEDKCLRFSASIDKKGRIQRISKIEEVSGQESVPVLAELESISLNDLASRASSYELIEGWVGRNNDGGLDIGNLETTLPVRVWYAGEYSKMLPELIVEAEKLTEGDHVKVFGFVAPSLSVNAVRILKC